VWRDLVLRLRPAKEGNRRNRQAFGIASSASIGHLITKATSIIFVEVLMVEEQGEHETFDGGCTCSAVRYRMASRPMVVHCCHCRWCQRETGASFALNAMIEADRVVLLRGQPEMVDTPSLSGKGQKILRCPTCRIALWSHYAGGGDKVSFVRVGTLDQPDRLPPDIHIFTASKQPWLQLPPGVPAMPEYYDREVYWPAESLARREALLG
jgi:hypothetical protein